MDAATQTASLRYSHRLTQTVSKVKVQIPLQRTMYGLETRLVVAIRDALHTNLVTLTEAIYQPRKVSNRQSKQAHLSDLNLKVLGWGLDADMKVP